MLGFALFLATASIGGSEPALYRPSEPAIMILAEGEGEVDPDAKPKPKPKRKVAKPKTADPVEKTETPTGPIPYTAPADKTATPATAIPLATPTPLPPPEPVGPSYLAPQPKPDPLATSPVREVSLRCETLVIYGPKDSSRGTFILSLIPSLVNPDAFADMRVMSIDQKHRSIIRDTRCFSYMCGVTVTPTYYELSTPNRNKSQLKLTFNRQTGAFYAYERHPESVASGLITLSKRAEVNESGWCVPETPGKTLF